MVPDWSDGLVSITSHYTLESNICDRSSRALNLLSLGENTVKHTDQNDNKHKLNSSSGDNSYESQTMGEKSVDRLQKNINTALKKIRGIPWLVKLLLRVNIVEIRYQLCCSFFPPGLNHSFTILATLGMKREYTLEWTLPTELPSQLSN